MRTSASEEPPPLVRKTTALDNPLTLVCKMTALDNPPPPWLRTSSHGQHLRI